MVRSVAGTLGNLPGPLQGDHSRARIVSSVL